MTDFVTIVQISIGAVLIQNFVLARFLGLCPFLGVSKKLSSATGMGMAVLFVMTIASMCIWWVDHAILIAMNEEFLRTIVFILIIASLVQLMELVMQKFTPALYESLGIYLPLAATNCAILGVVIINTGANPFTGNEFTFIEATVNGAAAGVGFLLALVLMAGLRERLELADIPKSMEGFPIAFITAGLMALAFLGFSGLSFFPGGH
ncbi:MAG: RnfABCDGE type electron transport complex subunit A [Chitinispirillia bacterium]|nr:RnfABCDGE type electron transport complex subunit A [Chitinispirillia bacterium]MCL2268654.1 RnfABCDGE type electron transport complex subunit A [Chitinispirillia bacterium]